MMTPMDLETQLQHRQVMQQQLAVYYQYGTNRSLNGWPTLSHTLLPSEVSVELHNSTLWQQFYAETTEMIITKFGRRMFPSIQLNVSGLQKSELYYVLIEVIPISNRRHKYCGNNGGDNNNNTNNNTGGWTFAGCAELQPRSDRRIYIHPDSPSSGEHWMKNVINFNKLKLTNNIVEFGANVVLMSMHKYIPRIWIIRCNSAKTLNELFSHPASSFSFRETEFIAVTAYQNESITKLKIANNPFAKGFRETAQSRWNRKGSTIVRNDYTRIHADDEDANSSFEFDSTHSENSANSQKIEASIDNLTEKSDASELEIAACSDGDAFDRASPMNNAEHKAPIQAEENEHEDRVQSRFHRPWLNSPSSSEAAAPAQPATSRIPSLPSTLISPFISLIPNQIPHWLDYTPVHRNSPRFRYHYLMPYFSRSS